MNTHIPIEDTIRKRFHDEGIVVADITVRAFPGEVVVIVGVSTNYERAIEVASELDETFRSGFITIRRHQTSVQQKKFAVLKSVHDDRVNRLIELLNSRARTSEAQPSLRYVSSAAERINVAVSRRHHLVFGRRGVGKSALLLEARRIIAEQKNLSYWINLQSLRSLDAKRAFLVVASRLCDYCLAVAEVRSVQNRIINEIKIIKQSIATEESFGETPGFVDLLVPKLQYALGGLCNVLQVQLYLFLDDIHYLKRSDVPAFLDLVHGITRDNPMWIKAAGIRHQTRWFAPNPPTGLQTGHDAEIINLDITLEDPSMARSFLEHILQGYVDECGISTIRPVLGGATIDRLVLASGGVPRDFMSLCAAAMQISRQRSNARSVGVQDVNNAAGAAVTGKLQELEDDAAAARGGSQAYVSVLNEVRKFLLDDRQITFFRIDFLDKEKYQSEYDLVQALMDLRMIHLINSSLSDAHHAGRRSEVYLLDLSQYSGARLKHGLQVLDFVRDHLVLKRTRSDEPQRIADSPKRLVGLLRTGPIFELSRLKDISATQQ